MKKEEKNNLRKLKIEKGYKSVEWTQVITTSLICLIIVTGILALSFVYLTKTLTNTVKDIIIEGTDSISENIGAVLEENPEIAFAMNDDIPAEAMYMALLKQMGVEANFNFDSHFTIDESRSLEKTDLNCIDEYEYGHHLQKEYYPANTKAYIDALTWFEELKDSGCTIYHTSEKVSYFKCPKRNCEMREVTKEVQGDFIPTKLDINRIKIEGNIK